MERTDVKAIMKLRVPVIVRLGSRKMSLREVMNFSPGSLIELPREVGQPLDLMVNNKIIGDGEAVKVGENFGLRVKQVGDAAVRVRALGPDDDGG